ncbi:2-C-methyl-D-erythritol 4-phosphate cytidylyltransferase [Vibrio plantisponsor]|uniref:2-C-methyl-D-erythritol 4-phosphate cytidylyltransferase n=1 Tax=Vibrio plantisponsor TaxID=664643 RepID=A0ABU4IIV9_9VIBR|nr:2-C-methyl-D-erythritol 4-phosphate cytidylyltransferase [Vibrio plantisponsor]MDW6018064.1 2-C-methyl-D-erythritol 4-phosphate cytidylyltransferase [Vibrio plantisponsor]NNM39529.1 2-C-methyl-D-erythritol 4-phosphate cytidylyltransferase [Vibrio plantisponsor]
MDKSIIAVVPAAGVGSRMQADRPKQYLKLLGKTVLEHTVSKLLAHPKVSKVVVAVSEDDPYFSTLALANHPQVIRVNGGKERADSVLSALNYICKHEVSEWVLVHDAARPCFTEQDVTRLIECAEIHSVGAILAAPVRDTMKRSDELQNIDHTVERSNLWHALTPQMFRTLPLREALIDGLASKANITDEASAFERLNLSPALVNGRADNIKITQPEDLALAEFYLSRNKE